MNGAIGGYFGLELPSTEPAYFPQALAFQSARAAFLVLLKAGRPARVWVPWYICGSMLEPLDTAGIPVQRYGLDGNWCPEGDVQLAKNDWLLFVNYFGVNERAVDELMARFPRQQVVLDNSQAFYAKPQDCLATIFSPRKFFGVPDGGYLLTDLAVDLPKETDDGSLVRCSHLLKRLAGEPELGYADFSRAETSLQNQQPKRMSQLTAHLLRTIDYEEIRRRRLGNFRALHAKLGSFNRLKVDCNEDAGPLCYPFWPEQEGLRAQLIAARIFVPMYWNDVTESSQTVPEFERHFAREVLPLPCDQRYASHELSEVADFILDRLLKRNETRDERE